MGPGARGQHSAPQLTAISLDSFDTISIPTLGSICQKLPCGLNDNFLIEESSSHCLSCHRAIDRISTGIDSPSLIREGITRGYLTEYQKTDGFTQPLPAAKTETGKEMDSYGADE